jgi:hypothetical protein
MKEHRFIELLNLYIDRQISPEETAELEAELQRNPKRQAVYRQYCQIHQATRMVYESFRAIAADQPAAPAGRTGVVELFESRRRRASWAYYASGLAAAACVAFAVYRFNTATPVATPAVAIQPKPQPAAVASSPAPRMAEPAAVTVKATPNLVSLRNTIEVPADYAAMLAALREQDEERAFHSERLQAGLAAQPLFDDNLFDAHRVVPSQNPRLFRGKQDPSEQAEFSAFQFQR